MMSEPLVVCICGEPAANRCSSCKAVSYCSKECQRGDWKTHKIACKAATSVASSSSPSDVPSPTSLRRGSPTDLQQLIRVGAQHSIYQDTLQLGLEPDLISGVTGAEFYDEKDGSAKFWRLDGSVREEWENNARVDHRKAQRFWKTFLSPITDARKWVDIVLDAVLNVRLPSNNQPMWQTQVNANILAGLFPHLRHFTREQNTALLDIFVRHGPWYDHTGCFRLSSGTTVLFAHGQPSTDLIDQLVRRCLSWTRPYDELDTLLSGVALPMQKYWPDIVGTRILDLCFAMLSPGRPGSATGRTVPGDKILEIAESSPEACKHLLPVVERMCRARTILDPADRLVDIYDSFGVEIPRGGGGSTVLPWFMMEFVGDDHNTKRLQALLKLGMEGKLAQFGIKARDYTGTELKEMNRKAMERLGNPAPL